VFSIRWTTGKKINFLFDVTSLDRLLYDTGTWYFQTVRHSSSNYPLSRKVSTSAGPHSVFTVIIFVIMPRQVIKSTWTGLPLDSS
jgi:hypothetical protein